MRSNLERLRFRLAIDRVDRRFKTPSTGLGYEDIARDGSLYRVSVKWIGPAPYLTESEQIQVLPEVRQVVDICRRLRLSSSDINIMEFALTSE